LKLAWIFALKLDTDDIRRNRFVRILSKILTLEGVYVVAGVLLASGLINYLLQGGNISATVVFTRSLGTQSVLETIVYVIATTMGVGGTYLLLRSSMPAKIGRESFLIFVSGLLVVLIAFFLFFSLYYFKING
jgi:hypothetical protein